MAAALLLMKNMLPLRSFYFNLVALVILIPVSFAAQSSALIFSTTWFTNLWDAGLDKDENLQKYLYYHFKDFVVSHAKFQLPVSELLPEGFL